VVGKITKPIQTAFEQLLVVDSLRGTDSTGVASINIYMAPTIAKQMGNPFELLNTKSYDKALLPMSMALIGHNRYATQGGVNKANAHPFEFDSLIGVHNGTLKNKHVLINPGDYPVDSENLYAHMDVHGIKPTIALLKGAWSLVWWDKAERKMRYLRNSERPMYMAITKDGNNVFTASEGWMLEGVLSRNRIAYLDIFATKEDALISWPLDEKGNLENIEVEEGYQGAPEAVIGFQGYPYGNYGNGGQAQQQATQTPPTTTQPQTAVSTKKVVSAPKSTETSYAGSKDVFLEVLSSTKDIHGGEYYACFDPASKDRVIRMYKNPRDPVNYEYTDITADISNVLYLENDVRYYKVQVSSVTVLAANESAPETLFVNAAGKVLNRTAWVSQHGTCDMCTGHVDPDKAHRFTTSGNVICDQCIELPHIETYVSLR
jgi:hypothetical protein